jgi:Ca-activated chloride channel family protein
MRKVLFLLCIAVFSVSTFAQEITEGSLYAVTKKGTELGACPLKHTSVKTDISGFLARVRVTQEFQNSFNEPIEAVYTFPLSQNGAVDEMTMKIGDRTISGKIMKREEARRVYETAKTEGKTASLLDQERPNIFTQAVANIMPGDKVVIEISYVETLKYEDGSYEFVFPMVVGPRYIPASQNKADAKKISPPVAAERAGHDISVEVNLNAGVPIEEIRSVSHGIEQINYTPNTAKITLKDQNTILNKDFILRYDVSGKRIEDAVLVHRDERGGFFTLILQPPDKIATEDRTPKEIVFVLDTSGSMYGFPLDKAKEAMKMSIEGLYPDDTFNLITFSGDTSVLFDKPVRATQENIDKAQTFLESRQGGGGTEMMKAIKASMDPSDASDHLRIVCFMTDGYVGNDNEIIAEIQKHPNARVFSFGIGSSVNRFLLDKMAAEGKGEVEYVTLTEDGTKAAKKFYERVRTPLLTDLSIDWRDMPVADIYPNKLTDLFSAKPVIVHGRFTKAASGTIKLKGKIAGQPYEREIKLDLPESENANDSLASLWARTRIDDLTSAKTSPEITAMPKPENTVKIANIDKEIASIGLEFRLLTDFTSFVAVEDKVVNQNGQPVTVQVPVELPEGVNRATTLGESAQKTADQSSLPVNGRNLSNFALLSGGVSETVTVSKDKPQYRKPTAKRASGQGGGIGSGSGAGVGSGNGSGSAGGSVNIITRSGTNATAPVILSGADSTDGPVQQNVTPKAPLTPEELREQRLKTKLHGWLYAIVIRLDKKDSSPGPNEAAFVREGKAAIRIELSEASPETFEKLKALGFELVSQKGDKTLIGQIPIEKLAALADIDAVNLILPKL